MVSISHVCVRYLSRTANRRVNSRPILDAHSDAVVAINESAVSAGMAGGVVADMSNPINTELTPNSMFKRDFVRVCKVFFDTCNDVTTRKVR